jgi:Na+/H+ antiporter NhaD/arsenite permease-like protein
MHASEKHKRNIVVGIFVALALASLLFFNVFSHVLEQTAVVPVDAWWILPFILLLASIAVGPFIDRHWWEQKFHVVSFGLGLIVVLYYGLILGNPIRLFRTAYEYISFISLIGSLFIVAGGIHIHIRGKAAPWENIMYLGTGAVISNVLGTTGASMLLLRPYLRTNKYRIRGYHVVFFIFLVGNIGGALTPIGDPPLFLGYLKGVPFSWVFSKVGEIWIVAVGLLLVLFFCIDALFYYREPERIQRQAAVMDEPQASGLHNIFFLFVVLGAVFIQRPLMVREIVMWGAALGSLYTTRKEIHEKNEFNLHPIREVAILFAGIFATMIPALDWLNLHGASLGIITPGHYYWATGALSRDRKSVV